MARYIDADKIDYTVATVWADENAGYRAVAFEIDIDAMPTADVVPRGEVEKIFEEIEIIGKVDNGVFLYHRELAELKKKYTGEQT